MISVLVCLSVLLFFFHCYECFHLCCTKLKLHAKEKITEAATDEARLFAPLEQVCFQMFSHFDQVDHTMLSDVCILGTDHCRVCFHIFAPLVQVDMYMVRFCMFAFLEQVDQHGMLSDICTFGTGRYLHGILQCLQSWNRYIMLSFQTVAPMEKLHHTVLPNVCTLGRDRPILVLWNR
jgi:hypothetical protein